METNLNEQKQIALIFNKLMNVNNEQGQFSKMIDDFIHTESFRTENNTEIIDSVYKLRDYFKQKYENENANSLYAKATELINK